MKHYLLTLSLILFSCSSTPIASSGDQAGSADINFPASAYTNISLGVWQHNPEAGNTFAVNKMEKDGSGVVMWSLSFPAGVAFSDFKPHRQLGENQARSPNSFWFVDEKGQGSALTLPPSFSSGAGSVGGVVSLFKVEDYQTKNLIFSESGNGIFNVEVDRSGTGRFIIVHGFDDKEWECCETLPLRKVDVVEMTDHEASKTHSFDVLIRNQPFIDSAGNGFSLGIFSSESKDALYSESIDHYTTGEPSIIHPEGAGNFRVYHFSPPAISWTVRESDRNRLYLGSADAAAALKVIGPISLDEGKEIETAAFSDHGKGILVIEDAQNSELQIHHINDYTLTCQQTIPMTPGSKASLSSLSLDANGDGLLVWKEGSQPRNVINFIATIFTQKIKGHELVGEKFSVAGGVIGYVDVNLSEDGFGLIVWSQNGTETCQTSDCTAEVFGRIVSKYEPLSK